MLVLAIAWGCKAASPPADAAAPVGDSAIIPETCGDTEPGTVDFLGEPCTEAPAPAVTVCHADLGWCVAGICRPQCATGCPRCTDGVTRVTDRGACYCSPQ